MKLVSGALVLALGWSSGAHAAIHTRIFDEDLGEAFDHSLEESLDLPVRRSEMEILFGQANASRGLGVDGLVGLGEPIDDFLFEFLLGLDPVLDVEDPDEAID